jgi:hypothetical protein
MTRTRKLELNFKSNFTQSWVCVVGRRCQQRIGATERTAYILRVRQLAVGIAHAYVDQTTTKARSESLHS